MPQHVVVDGSNIATEGRSLPSLAQLNEAVMAFIAEYPEALITVVVDATFGHRIDPKETAEFDEAIANNELVAPPAGAVGRGDAFVLSIANKVNATILTNDSYQEFHGQVDWLFDEGRLIGGKPVPHVGWVFVPRLPVRGAVSRSAVKDAKRKRVGSGKGPGHGAAGKCCRQSADAGAQVATARGEAHSQRRRCGQGRDQFGPRRGGGGRIGDAQGSRRQRLPAVPGVRRASSGGQQRQRRRRELLVARRVRAGRRREGLRAAAADGRSGTAQRP